MAHCKIIVQKLQLVTADVLICLVGMLKVAIEVSNTFTQKYMKKFRTKIQSRMKGLHLPQIPCP